MKYDNMRVVDLKALSISKERGLRHYSKLRKAELITFLRNNLEPVSASQPCPRHPTKPPPPPPAPQHPQSVRFRPKKPREPKLLRQLEERHPQSVRPRQQQHPQSVRPKPATTLEPYQLKPKRGKIEPPVEVPLPSNPKQVKHMTKKSGKLNKKIRHSKRKHNNLISKRNSIKKKMAERKGARERNEEVFRPEESFNQESLSKLSIGLIRIIE